jgi:gamma-tubulin complex component 3
MNDYLKIFSFMWKLKKIQHSLSVAWGLTMAYRTPFSRLPAALQSKFHRFNLAHHEMSHFVTNVHNYILVEVLESAWTVFLTKLRAVADLDELIILQKKFVRDILDKALLSDQQRELYKLLQKLLNYVFMFTLIKEKYVYSTALQESERLKRCEEAMRNGLDIPDEDMVS